MTKRYRLTTRAQMHGEIREAGYVFTLEDGEVGPHKTISAAAPEAQIADHIGGESGVKDVPLYEELTEEHNAEIDRLEAEKIDEADMAAAAHPDVAEEQEPGDTNVNLIENHSGNPHGAPEPTGPGTPIPSDTTS